MKVKTKIWLGVGAFVLAGSGATTTSAIPPLAAETSSGVSGLPARSPDTAASPAASRGVVMAQHAGHDAGEGGESQGLANLPPDLAFAARVTLLRGHLLVGDELVKQQQWNAALPHFLHPTEEIYGDIKDQLAEYRVPPFDAALKTLSDVVKAKKGGADYAKALKAVNDAVAAADAGMKAKQANWPGFVVEAAVEALKAATGEYQQAVVGNRISKPVEYQARLHLAGGSHDRERRAGFATEGPCGARPGARGIGRVEEGVSLADAAAHAGEGLWRRARRSIQD